MQKHSVVGIDLGTSTSEIAILKDGKPVIIPDQQGNLIIPSVVGIGEDGRILVGQAAREQLLIRPTETVIEVKRLMGTDTKIEMGGRTWLPQDVSAEIIKHLVQYASEHLGEPVEQAVITVPAYFSEKQRQATVEAGRLAGITVERIINEPTAAALDYGLDHMQDCQNILVYDLGGGTLDVTILELFEGVLDVKASSGDNQLGGKDFDAALTDYFLERFHKKYAHDLSDDPRAMMRLKDAAEKCKIRLSASESSHVILPFIAEIDGQPAGFEEDITRGQFEEMISRKIESTEKPIRKALQDAKLKTDELDLILLVGGSTRIPLVRQFVSELLEQEPQDLVDPDLAVARGAAIQAGIISGALDQEQDILITDVCPYTLGISIRDQIGGISSSDVFDVIIPRNTTIPVVRNKQYGTVADNQTEVEIKVYQGDYRQASRNSSLGTFKLAGLPPAPAFKEKVDVAFSYDINGMLQVSATIVSTGGNADLRVDTTGVSQLKSETNLEKWQDMPGARKYRLLIRRAQKLMEQDGIGSAAFELDGLIKDLQRGLIEGLSPEQLEKVSDELHELVYDLEKDESEQDD